MLYNNALLVKILEALMQLTAAILNMPSGGGSGSGLSGSDQTKLSRSATSAVIQVPSGIQGTVVRSHNLNTTRIFAQIIRADGTPESNVVVVPDSATAVRIIVPASDTYTGEILLLTSTNLIAP